MHARLTLPRTIRKGLSLPKTYPIHEVNRWLATIDQYVEDKGLTASLILEIYEDKELLFKDDYTLGKAGVRNVLLLVSQTFESTLKEQSQEKKDDFFIQLEQSLKQETPKVEVTHVKEEPVDVISPTSTVKVDKPKRQNSKWLKKILVIMSSLLIVGGVAGGSIYLYTKREPAPTKEVLKLTLETYLENGNYDEALNLYHDEKSLVIIMRELAHQENDTLISEVNDRYESEVVSFYYQFYQENWLYVTEHLPSNLGNEEQLMLAHSYIQLGKVDEAIVLNKRLKSKRIAEGIRDVYIMEVIEMLRKDDIEKAKERQKANGLSELDDVIEEAQTYSDLIVLYEKNKDTENRDKWQKILKNLGKEGD